MEITVGTHNLLDGSGKATAFAQVIGFTEAIPWRVRLALRGRGYKSIVCRRQRDLVLAYRADLFKFTGKTKYVQYVKGRRKISPNRGTFSVQLRHIKTGELIWFNLEHRINAGFSPWIRGERTFREASWKVHTNGTLHTMNNQDENKHHTIGLGDVNTPEGVRGYPGFNEVGEHFDRIGSNRKLTDHKTLTTMGSDHHRELVTVHI